MRAEHVPQLLVAALGDQVEVHLAEGRQEAVRVIAGNRVPAVHGIDGVVGNRGAGERGDPHAAVLVLHLLASC